MNKFEIQAALAAFGLYKGKIDGIIGPRTLAAAKKLLDREAPKNQVPADSASRLLVAVEQLVMKIIGGLAVGPIDGYAGKLTEKARERLLRKSRPDPRPITCRSVCLPPHGQAFPSSAGFRSCPNTSA